MIRINFAFIVIITLLIVCVFSYGNWSFNKMVDKEINTFLPVNILETKAINDQMVNQLTFVVQK